MTTAGSPCRMTIAPRQKPTMTPAAIPIATGTGTTRFIDLTRSRRENPAFNYGFFRPNPLVFLRTAWENTGHASHSTDFGVAEQTEIVGSARKSSAHAPGVTDS